MVGNPVGRVGDQAQLVCRLRDLASQAQQFILPLAQPLQLVGFHLGRSGVLRAPTFAELGCLPAQRQILGPQFAYGMLLQQQRGNHRGSECKGRDYGFDFG